MSFPRNTDVAKHLSRKHKRVFRVRHVVISIDQVPDTDVQTIKPELSEILHADRYGVRSGGGDLGVPFSE
jgi:hypothetical protein